MRETSLGLSPWTTAAARIKIAKKTMLPDKMIQNRLFTDDGWLENQNMAMRKFVFQWCVERSEFGRGMIGIFLTKL